MAANMTSAEAMFENFCFMIVEEFLSLKAMNSTLHEFRTEWKRPNEDVCVVSWYEVALKLRLPDLITQNNMSGTILENVVQTIIRESSTRNRRSQDITLSGLATMPKTKPLPAIADATTRPNSPKRPMSSTNKIVSGTAAIENKPSKSKPKEDKNKVYIKRQLESTDKFGKVKLSNENWIPEQIRMRSLGRELAVAKETLGDYLVRENGIEKEMKRLALTDLQHAQVEESLGVTRKISCGCCLKKFLYVNLPLKVSRKAIMDIRIKWSGQLNSATVFSAAQSQQEMLDGTLQLQDTAESANELTSTKRSTIFDSKPSKKGETIGAVPKYYDEVGVCIFCAQFFSVQEAYRPSYSDIVHSEKKAVYFDKKRKEQEYWDPLKMCEKDRLALGIDDND